jgi:hypothetical protein
MTLDTRHGPLDLVQRVAGVTSDLLGVPVRVCSLEHLRRMKEARRGSQDIADRERRPPLE